MYSTEIEKSIVLQRIYYFVFFTFLLTFNDWYKAGYLTKESLDNFSAVCWPHFQGCTALYVFSSIPYGYSLGIMYAVLGAFLFCSLLFSFLNKWKVALVLLIVPLVYKFLMLYFFSFSPAGNFTVFEMCATAILVFSNNKTYNLKIFITLFYFLAVSLKFHEGYYTGNIFKSLELGVPLFSDVVLPYSGLIFMTVIILSPILLWSKNYIIRLSGVVTLVLFHLYSIILVGFRYPLLSITLLILLFYISEYERFSFKKLTQDIFSICLFLFLIILQILPIIIQGDEKITNEGQKYGFYMFDANRQCVSNKKIFYKNGQEETIIYENHKGFYRCDPYEEWFTITMRCKTGLVKKIEWQFNSSINGSSYYTLVDSENACNLIYKPFIHNKWIQEGVKNNNIKVYKNSVS